MDRMRLAPTFTDQSRTLGVCSFCGSGPGKERPNNPVSKDRHVVITDLDIDFEGSVEACLDCASEMGNLAGMISEAEATALRSERDHANSRAISAEAERDAARKALSAVTLELANREAAAAPAPARKTPAKKAAQ